jgi:uncharacterized protein (TIGR02117 family)
MRRTLQAVALVAVGILLLAFLTDRPGDPSLYPPGPSESVSILLVSNGYHSGLVLPVSLLAEIGSEHGQGAILSVASRFTHYDWVEVGWGEDAFYRSVPTVASMDYRLALRALFKPGNASVMHVIGIEGDPSAIYRQAETRWIALSRAGLAQLLAGVDRSFARGPDGQPQVLGTGLYGPSLFYRAEGTFHLFNLCNHWVARRLNEAGLPVSLAAATVPRGLMLDLRLRASP